MLTGLSKFSKNIIKDNMNHPITRASLNLTRACPLACSYCFTNGCTSGSLSLDIGKRAVDFLFGGAERCKGQERQVEISYWGGEPLLEWDLLQQLTLYAESVSKLKNISVRFGGTTNGVLLTEDKFDFLDEHKMFFLVSFDGTEDTHNYYRKYKDGRGSYSTVRKNLEKALARWPIYRVRMGPFAERIDHFFDDCKEIFDLGMDYLIFSPVYESGWNEERWAIFEDQCKKVIDHMVVLRSQGRRVEVEHFKSYTGKDDSKHPCGAGRFYVGIDIDGAIYPCHRFNKFNDSRPWQEKEVCIGHIDHGITRPEFRDRFINFHPQCEACPRLDDTPCHGGCYAANFDFTGDIEIPHIGACNYVNVQKRVSEYYRERLGMDEPTNNGKSCTCYNMCYLEGTDQETRSPDPSTDMTCICYNTNYAGGLNDQARPLTRDETQGSLKDGFTQKDRDTLRNIFMDIDKRLKALEEKVGK